MSVAGAARTGPPRAVAWLRATAIAAIVVAVSAGVATAVRIGLVASVETFALHNTVSAVVFGGVLFLAAPRHHDNRVVRLLAVIVTFCALQVLAVMGEGFVADGLNSVLDPAVVPAELSRPAAASLWLESWTWIPVVMGTTTLLLLWFPDGTTPSPRWRVVTWTSVIAQIALVAVLGTAYFPTQDTAVDRLLESGILGAVVNVAFPAWLVAAVASLAALVARGRRADGVVRQQIRLLAIGFGILIVAAIPSFATGVASETFAYTSLPGVIAVATAYGVALLRYRLHDVDVVVSRGLTYGTLAAVITAVYVTIVVGLGTLMGRGDEPDLLLSLLATAVVAVAFEPLRARVQRLANRLVYGHRATPYEVLARLTSGLSGTDGPDGPLDRLPTALADGTGAAQATVWLRLRDRLVPAASTGAVPPAVPLGSADELPGLPADLAEPVRHGGELLGALSIDKARGEAVTPADERLLADVASSAGIVLRNVRLNAELSQRAEDLRASRRRLVATQDAERRKLERDLHDGAQQRVVALKVKLGLGRTIAEREGAAEVAERVGSLADRAQQAVEQMRLVARGIYPPLLEAEGLRTALAAVVRVVDVPVTIHADEVGRYDREVEATVYFCLLESLRNVGAHAHATAATISLHDDGSTLRFAVTDDGRGFDPDTTPRGHGLTMIADRLDAAGGHLELDTAPGRGSTVRGHVPITDAAMVVPSAEVSP